MNSIITAVVAFGIIGLIVGVVLSIAAKAFEVKVDPRIEAVTECLPGANCGGCGFAGCSACAEAIVNGEAKIEDCTSINEESLKKISEIMGVESGTFVPKSAVVLCSGTNDCAEKKYDFDGTYSCVEISALAGGDKLCEYACLGYGDCVNVCKFGALSIKNGIADVDREKCTACGMCASVCPRGTIKIMPLNSKITVKCSSKDKGAVMKTKCTAGCIGCGICAKNCPVEAISVTDNLAYVDYEKCIGCGVCAEKCPKKVISLN